MKNAIRMIPSVRFKTETEEWSIKTSFAKTKITSAERKHNGISIQIVEDLTTTGKITAEIPRIIRMLIILLPMALPKLKPELSETADSIFTISSGEDVPKATIVKPITRLEMFFLLAIAAAPSTSQ